MKYAKGFATVSVFIVLTALMMITMYTGYVLHLQLCLQSHVSERKNIQTLISSAELYIRHFVKENWDKLLPCEQSPGEQIIIHNLFMPYLSNCHLTMHNWSFEQQGGSIRFFLTCNDCVVAKRELQFKRQSTEIVSWRSVSL